MVTVPVSSVPAVVEYLLSAIQSQAAADQLAADMVIRIGEPAMNFPPDMIWIGEVRRNENPQVFRGDGGQFWLNETYDVTVNISTWAATGDADDRSYVAAQLTERAWQLVAYVETAVRTDPSLGGLVEIAFPLHAITPGPQWTGDPGIKVVIEMPIHVEHLN